MTGFYSDIRSARKHATVGLIVLVCLFTGFEYFRKAPWGIALKGEWNLWTIASAMMDFQVGILAGACAWLAYYMGKRQISRDSAWKCWLLVSAAFTYFTFDETLEIHERLGRMLKHSAFERDLIGLHPHNMVEGCYYLAALVVTLFVIRNLRYNRTALTYYMLGIAFMGFQMALGLLPRPMLADRMPRMFAEVMEMSALTSFACCFISLLFSQIEQIAHSIMPRDVPGITTENIEQRLITDI